MRNLPHVGFILFLVVYSYFKYTAMPSMMGQPQYILTTGLVILMTAVIPFFTTYFLASQSKPPARYLLAAFMPLILSTLGLAIYFYLYIAPNAPGIPVTQVLPRAIIPGLVMSAILLLPMIAHKNN